MSLFPYASIAPTYLKPRYRCNAPHAGCYTLRKLRLHMLPVHRQLLQPGPINQLRRRRFGK